MIGKAYNGEAFLAGVCFTPWGAVINNHVLAEATHLVFMGKTWERSKDAFAVNHKRTSMLSNKEFSILNPRQGWAGGKKAWFGTPRVGAKVMLYWPDGTRSQGEIKTVDESGAFGKQMRTTCSSQAGVCGGLYVQDDGKIVGFHFSEGKKGQDNLGAPVDETWASALWNAKN
jgi:hypothetical protein